MREKEPYLKFNLCYIAYFPLRGKERIKKIGLLLRSLKTRRKMRHGLISFMTFFVMMILTSCATPCGC